MPHQKTAPFLILLCLAGCGHPASEQECQEIVERVTRLELEKAGGATDPKTIADQVAATKKSLESTTLKDCVGKRITGAAMQCVRGAKTSQQIVDDCFR
ncbi:MAG TPA: hypothetical protein VGI10_24060 [Polyangiaceae bacterium]|jgi:hypothetical protein